jgi:hypothetical protein
MFNRRGTYLFLKIAVIVRVMKESRMRWAGDTARMGWE